MPALNYKAQFASMIERGLKRSTIRAPRKDGRNPKPGQTLYHYTGMRTKQCRMRAETICRSVRLIYITRFGDLRIETRWSSIYLLNDVARKDGFKDWSELISFFRTTHGLPFTGLLIEW